MEGISTERRAELDELYPVGWNVASDRASADELYGSGITAVFPAGGIWTEIPYFTSDRVEITPGLKVMTNEAKWGVIDPAQFIRGCNTDPGGQYFDGWFIVLYENGDRALMNGERLRTTEIPGIRY